MPFWPPNLKRISIFEHFGVFDLHDLPEESMQRSRFAFLGHGLRRLSTGLEELGVSFIADARDFFEPFIKLNLPHPNPRNGHIQLPQWDRLRWLTLTSSSISEFTFSDELNGLLRGAGLAAKSMPALQAMEIYNATRWHAGIFRYLVVDNIGVVSWTSTWEFKLDGSVKAVWRQVALQSTRKEPYFFDEVKMGDYKGGREGFIHSELATRELALHPVSSRDMMKNRPLPEPVLRLRNLPPVELSAVPPVI